MKYYLTIIFFSFFSNILLAQDFEYGILSGDDLKLKNTQLDSNANAIVIREFGTASLRIDYELGRTYVDYEYHVKIKIFNKNGFNQGNIVIPLRSYAETSDEIKELKATTMNFVNGAVVKTDLDKKKIFNEKRNKYITLAKFTMPNLMEESVIEYSYRIHQPSIFNFKSWSFQSDIPKLHSEYIAYIPALYTYNVSLRGHKTLNVQTAKLQKDCLVIGTTKADCSKLTYIMNDVPAFIEEDYMTSADNFRSAMHFELSEYVTSTGGKVNVTKNWKDVDKELMDDKSFGAQWKKQDVVKPLLTEILNGATDDLSKAKAIYSFISKNIRHNGFIGIYAENSVKKALEMKSGNTGDINLALITTLSAAGLDVEAVILSTRSNGTLNSLYPVISEFNYLVAKLNIGTDVYMLDASQPKLPFGMLPIQCLNGNGRAISQKKASYWYDLKPSQKETTKYVLEATLENNGKIKGMLTTYSIGYAALRKRDMVAAAGSIDEFVEKFDEQLPGIKILTHNIQNLDTLDNPIVENYEIEMDAFENMNAERLYFNPFFINRITKNPFNLNERNYPIDLGAAKEDRVTMVIKLPDNVSLAEQPKNISLSLPDAGGKYIVNTSVEGNQLSFSQVFQLNKPSYDAQEYLNLKEFFSRVIQQQKSDVILKKTK